MIFEIQAEKNENDKKVFYYDNETNTLKDSFGNTFEYPKDNVKKNQNRSPVVPFSKDVPLKKSKAVRLLKIQLGLSCNYSCSYCNQKFVGRPPESSKKDIDNFLEKISNLEFSEEKGLKIEFWGGEPFVYWKTMKPLAEELREKFAHWRKRPHFSVITNGSILTEEICSWLLYMGFSVGISHDGPGQSVRGPDPFDDPKKKKTILDFYKIMRPLGRISFNSMLNEKNRSRKEIYEWFANLTGDPTVPLGEGGIVDAYDDDGISNSLNTKKSHFEFRQKAFADIYSSEGKIGFGSILEKIDTFTKSVLSHNESKYLNQKCGMDDPEVMAIDMQGNLITCQNVSAIEPAMNGTSHLGGNIDDFENIELRSATHWMNRPDCANCPTLHICQGACMFLDGKYWEASCNNAYSDTIALFALSFEKMTGYIPVYINNDILPPERRDIWGTKLEHKEELKHKPFPVKVVTEKKKIVNDIEVFEQAKLEY